MLLPPTRLIIQYIIQNFGEISNRKPFLSAIKHYEGGLHQEHVGCIGIISALTFVVQLDFEFYEM